MSHKYFQLLRVFIAAGCCLLAALPMVVSAADNVRITLAWDEGNSSVDGYNLYQRVEGEAFDYNNPVNDGLIVEKNYVVENIQSGVRYFFVVSAISGDEESEDSNEVVFFDRDGDGFSDAVSSISSGQMTSSDSAGSGCFIDTTK